MNSVPLVIIPYVVYSLPLWIWWYLRLYLAGDAYVDARFVSREAFSIALMCHLTLTVLVMPAVLRGTLTRQWQSLLILLLLPLAFWNLLYMAGGLTLLGLGKSIGILAAVAIAIWLTLSLLTTRVISPGSRGLLFPFCQSVLLLLIWGYRQVLLQWSGG